MFRVMDKVRFSVRARVFVFRAQDLMFNFNGVFGYWYFGLGV